MASKYAPEVFAHLPRSIASSAMLFLLAISLSLALIPSASAQTYVLHRSFVGTDFFNQDFELYNGWDPTFGYVQYVCPVFDAQAID